MRAALIQCVVGCTHSHTYLPTGEDAALFVVEGYVQCHVLSSSSRHRMTEREEDEELLLGEKDDIEESSNITHFSESPYCESVRGGEGMGREGAGGLMWEGRAGCWWLSVQCCTVWGVKGLR